MQEHVDLDVGPLGRSCQHAAKSLCSRGNKCNHAMPANGTVMQAPVDCS